MSENTPVYVAGFDRGDFPNGDWSTVTTLSIFGAIIYKLVVAIALWLKLNPNDLKILTAILVAVALAGNSNIFKIKHKSKINKNNAEGGEKDVEDSEAMQSI